MSVGFFATHCAEQICFDARYELHWKTHSAPSLVKGCDLLSRHWGWLRYRNFRRHRTHYARHQRWRRRSAGALVFRIVPFTTMVALINSRRSTDVPRQRKNCAESDGRTG